MPISPAIGGGQAVASLPPEYAELNSHRAAACSSGLQQRHQSTSAGYQALVPRGLNPVDHFLIGGEVRSPIEKSVDIPYDLEFALVTTVGQGVHIDEWRQRQFNNLQNTCRPFEQMANSLLDGRRSQCSRA